MSGGAACPDEPPPRQINPNASHNELSHNDQAIEALPRACPIGVQKRLASCMIRAKDQYGDNLNVEILLEDEVVVAAGRNSHWARRRKIGLSDIADGPWTGAPPETMARIVLDNAFRAASLPVPKSEVTTFSVPLRQHLLTVGGFLTAMPKSLLHGSSGLKALPIVLPPHDYPIAIVTVKNRTLSPVVELFLERLGQFRKSPDMTRPEDRARR
jgi:DNA-binding transcriptional LysR family regulator